MRLRFLTTPLALALLASAHATVVANYNFTAIDDLNESTSTFLSASIDADAGSTASDMTSPATHNGGVVHPEFGDVFNNAGNQAIGWSARGNNPAQAFSIVNPVDTFFSFSVAAEGGHALDFETISLVTGVATTLGNLTAFDYTLSYSTDGASFLPVATVVAGTNPGEAATIPVNGTATAAISFDLSGVTALQDVTGIAYFQLDPVASGNQNGVQSQRAGFIDDLVVNADVTVVPEPAVGLLGALGLLALHRRRR